MRSDFLGDCTVFPGLPQDLNDGQFLCPRLSRDQCREAIEGPAAVFREDVEPSVTNRILNDIGTELDQLPLMQHALMRAWNVARDKLDTDSGEPSLRLSLLDYEGVGGLRDALSQHADEAYAEVIRAGHGRLAAVLFRSLSDCGLDGQDVRRPVSVHEVASVGEASDQSVIEVVEAFRRPDRCFLVPPAGIALKADTVIDVSHESLIRQWDRLQTWVQTEDKSAARFRRLAQSAALRSTERGELLRGLELEDVREWRDRERPIAAWADRYHRNSFDLAMAFLNQSDEQHRREREAEELEQPRELERRQKELETAQRLADEQTARVKTFRRMAIGIALVAVVALGLFAWALRERKKAEPALAAERVASTQQEPAAIMGESVQQAVIQL